MRLQQLPAHCIKNRRNKSVGMRKVLNKALQVIIGMIIIHLRFTGGSAGEGHDIAHIASSIMLPASCGLFFSS